ncbi:MAG: patatin-like phospholipase family protein [Clostridia bacterium]|nr:patatin-like phospholipase family protein [Clostridia bacterium]
MNIGLVLAGGFAKGAYQIGALQALNNFIPVDEIKYMSCTSIGALNGYAYITKNLEAAKQMWTSACRDDARLWVTKILRSNMLQEKIANLHSLNKTISSAFYCSLFDVTNRNVVYQDLSKVDNKDVPLYLKASIALPAYSHAVHIGDMTCYDGGLIDNIPVFPLLKHDLDYIICIYFDDTCYKFENDNFDNRIIKLTFPSESMIKHSFIVTQERIEEMIKGGYDRTMEVLESVFAKGYDNLDSVYGAIGKLNQENPNPNSLRLTTDVVITNLNKATQKLTNKKII